MLFAVFGFGGCSLRTRRITDFAGLEDLPTNPDRVVFTQLISIMNEYEQGDFSFTGYRITRKVPANKIAYFVEILFSLVFVRVLYSTAHSYESMNLYLGENSWHFTVPAIREQGRRFTLNSSSDERLMAFILELAYTSEAWMSPCVCSYSFCSCCYDFNCGCSCCTCI